MKLKTILLYLLYFIAAVIFFMVVLFPQKQAANKIAKDLNQNTMSLHVDIEKAKPLLPAGLKLENTQITLKNGFNIKPENFKIKIDPLSLFKDGKNIKFDASVFEGRIKGSASDFSLSDMTCSKFNLNGSSIKGEKIKYQTSFFDVELSFSLNAGCSYPDKKNQSKGQLVFNHLNLKLKKSLFNQIGIENLIFENASLDFHSNAKEITIHKLTGTGNFLNVKLTGDIKSANNFEESFLNLKGHILPKPAFISKISNVSSVMKVFKNSKKSGIPIKITGTIKEPKIEL